MGLTAARTLQTSAMSDANLWSEVENHFAMTVSRTLVNGIRKGFRSIGSLRVTVIVCSGSWMVRTMARPIRLDIPA
jgi:hypothetical protein